MINELKEYNKKLYKKKYNINLLHWELLVEAPDKVSDYLIELINDEELELFKLSTSDEYKRLLINYLENAEDKDSDFYRISKNNLDVLLKNERIPEDFLREYNEVCAKSNKVWEKAKKENNYELYKPYLKKVIELTKKYYSYYDPKKNLYDAMLDKYESGMTTEILDKLFDELKKEIIPLIQNVKIDEPPVKYYLKEYTRDELMECAKVLLEYIGFDMSRGSLGIYPHGFMEKLTTNDVRIAFNHTNDPISFVSTIIHEGGHGLFEQNMGIDIANENIDLYALHESQSRFFENILGRNINFWYPIYDKIKEILKLDITIEDFVDEMNHVIPSKIRIDADELTYCLHIIIRYEIEKEIFEGNISIDDLPSLWNEKMKSYLGVIVERDDEGLMQDTHWSDGSFGYFPSYLIGNIYDGMYKKAIEKELGNIDELLYNGNIKTITEYLASNIYVHGASYNGIEVVKRLTGEYVNVKPLIEYFKTKYLKKER